MSEQRTFAGLAWDRKGKVTRREQFLGEMNAVVPWVCLVSVVEPHYPKGEVGRPAMDLELMLRIYFVQQWFDLSEPGGRGLDLRVRVDPTVRGCGTGRRPGAG